MPKSKDNFFAENLFELRAKKTGETQEATAKALGVSRHTYGSWEQGRGTPEYDVLIKIATHYKVTIDTLLTTQIRFVQEEAEA